MIGGEVGWWGGGGGNYNGERNQLGKLGKFISFTTYYKCYCNMALIIHKKNAQPILLPEASFLFIGDIFTPSNTRRTHTHLYVQVYHHSCILEVKLQFRYLYWYCASQYYLSQGWVT